MQIPQEIKDVVAAKRIAAINPDAQLYYSWVFDPVTANVHLSEDHGKERRHKTHHRELAEKVGHHPDRVHGYAYRIHGGWRITDHEHKKVDRFVSTQVTRKIHHQENKTSDV